ncbi:hypothetical protein [Nocardia jiangsuensis]|uniref:Glycoside hydrolase family 42 N-terminal domain-containing protein n=1 Tax=Nocardia jiangsuensis TaxID=1691563 RepID=A0ABV8DP72_9NOCA
MWKKVLAVASALLLSNAAPLSHAEPAAAPTPSRLVFAAAEEVSTLHGFTAGQAPDPETYWTVPRDLSMYTPELWQLLGDRHARISINMRWQRDFGPIPAGKPHFDELPALLRTAERNNVGVVAWLTVPYGDGYWATEDNLALHEQMVRDFDTWAREIGFRPRQVLLDLEAPLADTATLGNLPRQPVPVVRMLGENIDPAGQCAAMRGYERVVAWLEDHGYPATAATYSFLFDDITDGDTAFTDGLNMPLSRPGTFREVAFMAMRSVYAGLLGTDPGPSIHAAYIQDMRRWYGDAATFSLGEAGEGPYKDDLNEMITDTRLAAALTTGDVGIYSLDKALADYGLDGVARLFDAVEAPLAGAELERASTLSPGAIAARGLIGAENILAGALAAGVSRQPNSWPPSC